MKAFEDDDACPPPPTQWTLRQVKEAKNERCQWRLDKVERSALVNRSANGVGWVSLL